MFGNVIYYDRNKVAEYKTIISGKQNIQIEEYDISRDQGAHLGLNILRADAKGNKTYKAKVIESLLYDCNEFENMLDGRDDFFDLVRSSNYDIETMNRGSIIKIDGYLKIPEEFDLTQTIGKFKPLLFSELSKQNTDPLEQSALKIFLDTPNAKIPVIIDFVDSILCTKLISENMIVNYEDMEDFEELEVTILARITSNRLVSKEKPFYDPLKDFMSINRAMRRNMDSRGDGLNEIWVDEEYRTIETLAIYQ